MSNSSTELSRRFERLSDIYDIMNAMKTLSVAETKKLTRFIDNQRQMRQNIEDVAADFASFYPIDYNASTPQTLIIAVGSERGFCGSFNERVSHELKDRMRELNGRSRLVVIGDRLGSKLENSGMAFCTLAGASIAEDVQHVVDNLADILEEASIIRILAHDDKGEVVLKSLLPIEIPQPKQNGFAPLLGLSSEDFLDGMLEQYLLSALYGFLYESLLAENIERLSHMEQALGRLDKTIMDIAHQRNVLRQAKIIEEIEVILAGEELFLVKTNGNTHEPLTS
jgi:F-type H+-transporting ATPase subunit gamma